VTERVCSSCPLREASHASFPRPPSASTASPSLRIARKIAFIESSGSRDDLAVVQSDGSGERVLLADVYWPDSPPVWSPDGTKIAAVSDRGRDRHEIVVLSADGGGRIAVPLPTAGASSKSPSWSPDGGALAYEAQRSARISDGNDVYVAKLGDLSASPVTLPFPDGGSNRQPFWLRSTIGGTPVGVRPTKVLRISPTAAVRIPDVSALAADGSRAAVMYQCGVAIWQLSSKPSLIRLRNPCGYGWSTTRDLALADRRVAWVRVLYRQGNNVAADIVVADTVHRHVAPVAFADISIDDDGPGHYLGNLGGDGGLLAFNTWTWNGRARTAWKTWSIEPAPGPGPCPAAPDSSLSTGGSRLCARVERPGATRLLAVDAGRLALSAGSSVVIVDRDGRLLSRVRVGAAAEAAGLDKRTLVVLARGRLRVYDLISSRLVRTLPLRVTANKTAALEDVRGGLAVYLTGAAIHLLRLSDGRDVALYAPGQGIQLHAKLEKRGLFYAYNEIHAPPGARLVFVPNARLRRAFRK
jgi:dipeptidyl aminopeptidase/acylaminoacyl peptidase